MSHETTNPPESTEEGMYKRERLHVRWATPDAELVRAAVQKLDMSISEFVRRAAVAAAIEALHRGVVPPRHTEGGPSRE